MTIELWRERWLSSINELTSLDLQRKSWLDKTNTNPHWSFIEFLCGYFDNLSIDDSYQYQLVNGFVTEQEYKVIEDWHQAINRYNSPKNDDYDNQAVLNDSSWLEILKKGIYAKSELAKLLSADEVRFLTKEIEHLKFI